MVLYGLCLHPLLRTLEENLPGKQLGRHKRRVLAVAYADDVTVLVTRPEDFVIIRNAVHCYEEATGVVLNPQKSKALVIEGWTQPPTELGIVFHDLSRSLGSHMDLQLHSQ
jgi:hypothetical protein